MKFFGHAKEIGQEEFQKFLTKYGKEYAGAYVELGSRCYQANANRISGALIQEIVSSENKKPIDMQTQSAIY